jgi:N-acetylneuraminic acid mutarotase
VNGKIFLVGGFIANVHVGAVDRVFEYDPAYDSWRAVASLSAPRGSPVVVTLNGKIHAIAGRNVEMEMQTTHEVYDPGTDSWAFAAPIPEARDHTGIAVVEGKIHVFGGRDGATANRLGTHFIYDPKTDSWTRAASLLTPRSAGVGFYLNGRIVYAGGECKDRSIRQTFDEVEAYDPDTDSWTALTPMPAGRHAAGVVVMDDEAYIIGGNIGCGGRQPAKDVLVFRLR